MAKYQCTICGFIYDEDQGIPAAGIAAGTKWENLPADRKCPDCGAPKEMFDRMPEAGTAKPEKAPAAAPVQAAAPEAPGAYSAGELSAIFSNLAKGAEKQCLSEVSGLFQRLAEYYHGKTATGEDNSLAAYGQLLSADLKEGLSACNEKSKADGDRGSLRAVTWATKASNIASALLERYQKEGEAMLKGQKIWVCSICGFIYIGDNAPDICPVCKVPSFKILEVKGEN